MTTVPRFPRPVYSGKYTKEQIVEARKAWVARLRAGDLKQTKGRLHIEIEEQPSTFEQIESRGVLPGDHIENGDAMSGLCCLGVACVELLPVDVVQPAEYYYQNEHNDLVVYRLYHYGSGYEELILPVEAAEKLGFVHSNPEVWVAEEGLPDGGRWYDLSELNDNYEYSFEQIADVIEAQDEDWDGKRP